MAFEESHFKFQPTRGEEGDASLREAKEDRSEFELKRLMHYDFNGIEIHMNMETGATLDLV